MRLTAILLCLTLAACGDSAGSDMPEQAPVRAVAAFNDVITACSAGTSDAGVIDQRAMASAGWTVAARSMQLNAENRRVAVGEYPVLRAGEYEATEWRHAGHVGALHLVRWDELTTNRSPDTCMMDVRIADPAGLGAVLAGMTQRFARAPDRTGLVPRGGDFLTPRDDPQQTGHYWALPRNNIFLQISPNGFARIEVVAMPNRDTLDQYSPDRPENRLVILPGEPEK